MGVEGSVMIEREKPDRDWKEYNEQLVQRGEILLAVESLSGWQEELGLALDPDLGYVPREGEEVVIAVDGTGIKVTNRGEWMRKKRKGYIKIHVAVDTRTKQVVSLEVSDERTDDGEKLVPLVRKAKRKARVKKVLGDGGYDTHDNFKFLAASGIEAGIKVREDSNPNCGGARGEVVRAYLRDPPRWKEEVGYGRRWMAESAVSAS